MKKLIEFQEVKHSEVLDVINKFREDNGTTFSESIRRLILLSQNGCAPIPESIIYTTEDKRIDEIEGKVDRLVKMFKKHLEKEKE
jgi:transcription initiation factor IIE alpha subunit